MTIFALNLAEDDSGFIASYIMGYPDLWKNDASEAEVTWFDS